MVGLDLLTMERTPEQRELWLTGLSIQNKVRDFIFETLAEVNGCDYGVRFINSHVEISIGISTNLFREEVKVVLFPEDDVEALVAVMKSELEILYNDMRNA